MAVSTATRSSVTPLVSWDKAQQQSKPLTKKTNPIVVAVVVAMVVLILSGLWRAFSRPATGQWIEVMAARGDIQVGSRLGITNISFLKVPKQFASPDMIMSLNNAAGHVARTFIPSGEPIKEYMLFRGHGGLSSSLESHERAITLQLEDDALVDHAIMPEDRVDIMVISNKGEKKFTKTICQAVRVLMTSPKEQIAHRGGAAGNKITLALSPDSTEIVNEAAETGKIRLVLRSCVSRSEQKLAGSGPEGLLPALAMEKDMAIKPIEVNGENPSAMIPPPPLPAPLLPPALATSMAAPPPGPIEWMVEVISGSHKENYAVPEK